MHILRQTLTYPDLILYTKTDSHGTQYLRVIYESPKGIKRTVYETENIETEHQEVNHYFLNALYKTLSQWGLVP